MNESGSLRARARRLWPLLVALAIAAGVFVFVRTLVVGHLRKADRTRLLLDATFLTRLFTMLRVIDGMGAALVLAREFVRGLFVPAASKLQTSFDCHDVARDSRAIRCGGDRLALRTLDSRRSRSRFSGSALTLLIPSNLILVTGFILAERTLFLASAGVAICAGSRSCISRTL